MSQRSVCLMAELSDEGRDRSNVGGRRSEVHDTGAQRISTIDHHVREEQLSALLHRGQEFLIEAVEI